MPLSLSDAAKRAKLSTDELKLHIESGKLVAGRASDGPSARYLIEESDLDAFLAANQSFTELWSDDKELDEHEEQLVLGTSAGGSLRKVLTVEAVSELRVHYRILTGRVETLERLFSEFIEAEKTLDNTLVLNDSWKVPGEEKAEASRPEVISESSKTDSAPAAAPEKLGKVSQKQAPSSDDLKSKLSAATDLEVDEHETPVGSIDLRLQEYERRLAEAKQTATRLWH